MHSILKKHYRRMQGFMAFFIACLFAVLFLVPGFLQSYPGIFLLSFLGFALVWGIWFRWSLRWDGVSQAEFKLYLCSQPMVIVMQIILLLFTIIQAIRLVAIK